MNWIKTIGKPLYKLKEKYKPLAWYSKILVWIGIIILFHFLYLLALILVFPPITTTQLASLMNRHGAIKEYVPLRNISSNALLAVIASEDQLFMEHYGFDLESIEKAMEYNKTKPKKVRGASTISQQVAKNVFLWQGRSWFRKGLEVYFTVMIETLWRKRRIIEMYLNVAEMGDGIFGIQAASKKYYNKDAANLSREEAAGIAAILPNPKKYRLKPMSQFIASRVGWILEQMDQLEADENILELLHKANYKIGSINSNYKYPPQEEMRKEQVIPDSVKIESPIVKPDSL